MKLFLLPPAGLAAMMLCINQAEAHSWVEKLLLIASNGTFVGAPGFPRGFVPRSSPEFSDFVSENQVPPDGRSTANEVLPTDLMCRESQSVGNQTDGSPALVAAPGDNVALIYEENGHVTLLESSPTKPLGSGTVFIYGTKQPSNKDTYLGIHRVWNTEGTGGDKRGKLLATRPFDDGQCYQNNTSPLAKARRAKLGTEGNDLPCQADVQLPEDAGTNGSYTLYWLWEWPTLDDTTGKILTNQSYTTCMDISMISKKLPDAGNFNAKQLVDFRAIESELSTAILINPTAAEQLTTAKSAAVSKATASAKPAVGALNATPSDGKETVTVTVTAAAAPCTATPAPVAATTSMSPPASNSINLSSDGATTRTMSTLSQSTADASLTALPIVHPFLDLNSAFITGSSMATISTTSDAAPTKPPASAATTGSQASSTTSAAQCTKTAAGSRRRRRNRQRDSS